MPHIDEAMHSNEYPMALCLWITTFGTHTLTHER
jgi:hypothetical protein